MQQQIDESNKKKIDVECKRDIKGKSDDLKKI